jgi:hypothetical protein
LKLNNSSGEEAYEIDEGVFGSYDGIEDESGEDDAESSVDLFIRFLQSMFKKMSKRAKKASRSVLPTVISPQLVSFSFFLHYYYFGVFRFLHFIATKLLL